MKENQALACRIATKLSKFTGVDWRVGIIRKSISELKGIKNIYKVGCIVLYITPKNDSESVYVHKVPILNIAGAIDKDFIELSKNLIAKGMKIPRKCIQ